MKETLDRLEPLPKQEPPPVRKPCCKADCFQDGEPIDRVPTESVRANPKDVAAIALNKTPLHLVPPEAELLIAKVLHSGAVKYGAWNWRGEPIGLMTYLGAILRHTNAIRRGEDIDPESGLPHLAHIAATAAIVIDANLHETLVDDRPEGEIK